MRTTGRMHTVIVAAMEDTEALGFRFDPLSRDRCCHSGERRPRAFVRLVTGSASGVGNAIGAGRHRWNDESPNHQRAEVRGVGLTRMHGVARTSPKAHQPRDLLCVPSVRKALQGGPNLLHCGLGPLLFRNPPPKGTREFGV